MLPLHPPVLPAEPIYPTRDRLLRDPGLRQRAIAVLAAAALTGCSGDATPQPPSGTPASGGQQAAPVDVPGNAAVPEPAPTTPAPRALSGDSMAPVVPRAQALRGEAVAPTPPAPAPLAGKPSSPTPAPTVKP